MIKFPKGCTADLVLNDDGIGYHWVSDDAFTQEGLNTLYPMPTEGWLPMGTRNGWMLHVYQDLLDAGLEVVLTEDIEPPIREDGVVY